MAGKGWQAEEHVLAGPIRDLLRRALATEFHFETPIRGVGRGAAGQWLPNMGHATESHVRPSRNEWERRYAERFLTTQRTAARHFTLALTQPTLPLVIADRIAALVGIPLAYLEAVAAC